MKKWDFCEVMGDINENYIAEARIVNISKKTFWMKLGTIAACLCMCVLVGVGAWKSRSIDKTPTQQSGENMEELAAAERYFYEVEEGTFSTYVGGKVIAEDKVGDKIADVTLTAGWKNSANGEWITQENLRGEVYSIVGIANDVAVALKFTDKGEAVTTTHYYVIMNPNADLTAVEDYTID